MDDRIGVIVVPIFCPRIIGIAVENGIAPVVASACRIPTEADDD